jgi:hypothetical protein
VSVALPQAADPLVYFGCDLGPFPGVLRQLGDHGQLPDVAEHRVSGPGHHIEPVETVANAWYSSAVCQPRCS